MVNFWSLSQISRSCNVPAERVSFRSFRLLRHRRLGRNFPVPSRSIPVPFPDAPASWSPVARTGRCICGEKYTNLEEKNHWYLTMINDSEIRGRRMASAYVFVLFFFFSSGSRCAWNGPCRSTARNSLWRGVGLTCAVSAAILRYILSSWLF